MEDALTPDEERDLLSEGPAKPWTADLRKGPAQTKEQQRALRLLHENFSEGIGRSLSTLTGASVTASIDDIRIGPLPDGEGSLYALVSCSQGRLLLGLSSTLCASFIECLLGGENCASGGARPPSEIERRVLGQVLFPHILASYREAWRPVTQMELSVEQLLAGLQSIPGIPGHSEAWHIRMLVAIGGTDGRLDVVVPVDFLRPLLASLDVLRLLASPAPAPPSAEAQAALRRTIEGIPIELSAILGRLQLSLQDLGGLSVGDVMRLDARPDQEIPIEIEEKVKFMGRPGVVNGACGVEITRRMESGAL